MPSLDSSARGANVPVATSCATRPDYGPDYSQDAALMRKVAAGDRRAQQTLARRLIGPVRGRTGAMLRNPIDADDAAQIAIVEILECARNYRGEGSIEAWSDRITVRTALRQQRRRARRLHLVDERVDPDDIAATRSHDSPLPFELRRFFDELSPERREVFTLRHDGHKIEDIAKQLQLSPNTVKDRLRMARRELRQRIRQAETLAELRRTRS